MKQRIRLTEEDLHRIVKESVKKVIKEDVYTDSKVWDALDHLKEYLDDDTIIVRIISRMAPYEAARILNDIIKVECPDDEDEDI